MAKTERCPICHGWGLVDCPAYHGFLGTSASQCRICRGKERILCKACGGSGKIVVRDRETG